ncbi:Pyridoxal phosphate phosphatase YigL [invertebrate metagenome]|uniref:Pyridoxal phosphate phosphatase YigL n=1 Tax=invertebrate metagenome TaxID=1711999 RepID=A0A2H9T5K5_9ZZZZ
MFSLVVSDLDGTLLNDYHELSDYTIQVIRRLSEEGVEFVFATGRHYADVRKIRDQLGIDMHLITSNGARTHNCHGEEITGHDIPGEYLAPLVTIGRKYMDRVMTNIYQGNDWFVEQPSEVLQAFHKTSGFSYSLQPLDTLETGSLQKIFFMAEKHDQLSSLESEVRALFNEKLSITYSLPNCFEVMAKGVNKGKALSELLTIKSIDPSCVIAFGDGLNDVEMLSLAGKGIMMGNADQRMKDQLPGYEQIGYCNENAVAHYIKTILRI